MSPTEGQEKLCPNCGKPARFSAYVQMPGAGAAPVGDGGIIPDPRYQAAWECIDRCGYFELADDEKGGA